MNRNICCKSSTVIAVSVMTIASPALVQASEIIEQLENYSQEGQTKALEQVTNVDRLRDVYPTDWAYEALRGAEPRYV